MNPGREEADRERTAPGRELSDLAKEDGDLANPDEDRAVVGVAHELAAPLLKVGSDGFSTAMGIELLEVRPGYARAGLTLEDRHLNSLAVAHGGAIFGLADQAFALASNSHGQAAVAINMDISFVTAGRKGDRLIAEASEQHLGGRTGLYRIEVRTDAGKLIASCQGLVYRKRETLAELQTSP